MKSAGRLTNRECGRKTPNYRLIIPEDGAVGAVEDGAVEEVAVVIQPCLPRPAIQGTVAVTILPALRGQHTIKAGVEVMAQAMAVTLAGKVNAVHGTAHCCNGISKVKYV